jgi:hypothetical protein
MFHDGTGGNFPQDCLIAENHAHETGIYDIGTNMNEANE